MGKRGKGIGARQGQAWGDESPADRMVEEMWAKYRKTLKALMDGWEIRGKNLRFYPTCIIIIPVDVEALPFAKRICGKSFQPQ